MLSVIARKTASRNSLPNDSDNRKIINSAESQKETVKINDGNKRHQNHKQHIAQAETQNKHGHINRRRAAEQGGENEFAVVFSDLFAAVPCFLLRFEQTEGIEVDRKNIYRKQNVEKYHTACSMRNFRKIS